MAEPCLGCRGLACEECVAQTLILTEDEVLELREKFGIIIPLV